MEKLQTKIQASSGWVKEVGAVIQMDFTEPESRWVIDLKNGSGMAREGTYEKAQTRLLISERDFASLIKGETPVRVLYQTGKLRVDGDVTVAQRLEFLKSLA